MLADAQISGSVPLPARQLRWFLALAGVCPGVRSSSRTAGTIVLSNFPWRNRRDLGVLHTILLANCY